MILKEFIKEKKQEIEAFEKWWTENHKENPNHFPLELGAGDWDEQLNMFDSSMAEDEEDPTVKAYKNMNS